VEVFGRDESFDPHIDSIVRVDAGRLRRKLKLYYSDEGQNDPIHIEVPKGSYVPVWRVRPPPESPPSEGSAEGARAADSTEPVHTDRGPLEPQSVKRKLTTILAADVEGYSRHIDIDEEATLKTLSGYRQIIDGLIARHEGRLFGSAGDSVLAEFGSAVEAVRCAIAIQEELTTRNTELPDERRMRYRIGVNLGDVVVDGENLLGDGVNVASRLERMAEPSGICISGTVFEQVKNRLSVGFEDLGPQELRNIREPVRVYRVRLEPEAPTSIVPPLRPSRRWRWAAAAALAVVVILGGIATWNFYLRAPPPQIEPASVEKFAFPLPDKPSIAVLPFTNMSGDKEQEYFSDGITEDIITDLSRLPNLFVIARSSTFTYKGKPVKVKQVGRELGVRYVLEGSFRKAGTRVRITAQLVDAITGRHLWAERYDALQDEITQKVVTAMEVKLTEGEQARISRRQTDNVEAYQYYRRGVDQFRRFNKVGIAQARRLFEKAVSLDPNFTAAWPMLAMTHLLSARFGWSAGPTRDYARAEELAQKALAIDDSNSDAYRVLGQIFLEKRQHEKAIAYGEKSVTLEPNHSINTLSLGRILIYVGRPEEAVELFKRGMRLSPYYSTTFLRFLGNAYRMMGQYDEAIEALERGRARLPNSPLSYIWLAAAYAEAGRQEEARAAAAEILKLNPKFSVKRFAKAAPYKDPAELKRALDALRKAGLPE
jgi:adenylate cyclase